MRRPDRCAMRWRHAAGALLLFLWCSLVAQVQAAPRNVPLPVELGPADSKVEVHTLWTWVGHDDQAAPDKVIRGPWRWRATPSDTIHPLEAGKALWLRLRVQRHADAADLWVLELPMPVLDAVTLYQRDASGAWKAQSMGDTLPMASWPESGRYPFFRLQLRGDAPHDFYIQVRHSIPLSLPMRLVTAGEHDRRMKLEYMGIGMAVGALALLMAGCALRGYVLRDGGYAWYAVYALLSMLAVAAFTGIAAHLLWPGTGLWVDAAPGCLALLAGAAAMLIVRTLTGVVTRTRWLGKAIRATVWCGPLLAMLYLVLERRVGIAMLAAYLLTVAALSLWAAAFTWRRGDAVGRWMLMGAVPLVLSVLVALARVFGWLEASWLTEYAVVLALANDLPMLLGALNSRSRERRGAQLRQLAAGSQDPLTGLLKGPGFRARLAQALQRHERRGEGAAVAVIELVNYGWLKTSQGAEVAEESLLRAVIKLRRLVRDIDTTGRLGEARFGLVLEGATSREAVNQFASRLVAMGLMEEPGHPGEAPLRFHIAAVLLDEYAAPPDALLVRLIGVLQGMSARTHRPFRFLEVVHDSQPASEPQAQHEALAAPRGGRLTAYG